MARRKGPVDSGATTIGRVRVIFVDMEGDSDAIAGAIRDVTSVIRLGQTAVSPGVRSLRSADGGSTSENYEDDSNGVDNGEQEISAPPATADRPKASSSKRNLPKPKLVTDIDLRSGAMPLEKYVELKSPKSQIDKYLVAVGWFSEVGGVEEVGIDHVYTVFKAMKWTDLPPDVRQPLNDLERKKELLTKASRGFWTLNHLGEAELERMGTGKVSGES